MCMVYTGRLADYEKGMVMMENQKRIEKARVTDLIFFGIVLAIYTGMMGVLFYHQATGSEWRYHSDLRVYLLEMQGIETGCDFSYPLFFKFAAFWNLFMKPELAVTVALTVLNSFSMIFLKYYMNSLLWTEAIWKERKDHAGVGILLSVLTLTLFMVSMVFSPKGVFLPGIYKKYLGVFSPNPFHNATYLATRPFTIVCFFSFVRILGQYENTEKKINFADHVIFAVFLVLTTITKPTFTLVLVATAGLIMAWRLCKNRFRTLVPSLKAALCFVPTFGILLYQYSATFVPKEAGVETGIAFGMATAWKMYCGNIPLAVGLGLGFPIFLLLFHWKDFKEDNYYRFAWQFTVMSFLMLFFLHEKGVRLPDMNFSWGYMHGMFVTFATSLMVLVRSTVLKRDKKPVLVLEWLAYGWHLVCGVIYFAFIYGGGLYYYDV